MAIRARQHCHVCDRGGHDAIDHFVDPGEDQNFTLVSVVLLLVACLVLGFFLYLALAN